MVGIFEGVFEGIFEGCVVGIFDGDLVGIFEGVGDGRWVGKVSKGEDGEKVVDDGNVVDIFEGDLVGIFDGNVVGIDIGCVDGLVVGKFSKEEEKIVDDSGSGDGSSDDDSLEGQLLHSKSFTLMILLPTQQLLLGFKEIKKKSKK